MRLAAHADRYLPHLQEALAEDASRGAWAAEAWRAYYLTEVTGTKPYRLTSTGVLNLLGLARGSELLDAAAAANPRIADLLEPANEGLDVTHADATAFLTAIGATDAEQALLRALATHTGPRHKLLDLPDPRLKILRLALSQLAGG